MIMCNNLLSNIEVVYQMCITVCINILAEAYRKAKLRTSLVPDPDTVSYNTCRPFNQRQYCPYPFMTLYYLLKLFKWSIS